jgi:hypothetical protein
MEAAMNELFLVTGALAGFGALGHGYLGDRLVLTPVTRGTELPSTRFGGARQTAMMLRFTWHCFTVVMVSLAVVFLALGAGSLGVATGLWCGCSPGTSPFSGCWSWSCLVAVTSHG